MVSSLCLPPWVCTQATCYHNSPSIISWWCTFTCYDQTWHEPHKTNHTSSQSWANTSSYCRPATSCYSEKKPGEMAMLKAIGSWLDGSGWSYCDDFGQCDNRRTRGRSSESRTVQTSPVSGSIKWPHQHCIFFFKNHMQSMNTTLLMMSR